MKITKIRLIALISALAGIFTVSMDSFAKGRAKGSGVRRQRTAGSRDVVAPQVVEATPEVPAEAVVVDQKEAIQKAIAETQLIEQNAMNKMNEARQQLLNGEITPAQAIKIINEQNSIIAQAKQELKKTIAKSVEKVEKSDAEQSYLTYFTSGAQSLASRALAPFKSGYGYTQEEKELAKKTIKGLMKQKEQLTTDYEKARKAAPDYTARVDLKKRYDAITTELDNEIYQQRLITGEEMSTQRKLFWAAVVTGGAVAGLAALSSGGSVIAPQEQPSTPTQQPSLAPETSIEPISLVETGISVATPVSPEVLPESNVVVENMPQEQMPTSIMPEEARPEISPFEEIQVEEPVMELGIEAGQEIPMEPEMLSAMPAETPVTEEVMKSEGPTEQEVTIEPEMVSVMPEEITTPEEIGLETPVSIEVLTPESTEPTEEIVPASVSSEEETLNLPVEKTEVLAEEVPLAQLEADKLAEEAPKTETTQGEIEQVEQQPVVEKEGVFPWLKRVFSEKIAAREAGQLEQQLGEQERLAEANALVEAQAIEEAEKFAPQLALQREMQVASDSEQAERTAEEIRFAEGIERENLPFEQLSEQQAVVERKSAIDDLLTTQKGQREDLETAKIREMEARMAEEGRIDEELLPQQRELEALEDIKGPEQWESSKYAVLEQKREHQLLTDEIDNLEQQLEEDEQKLDEIIAQEQREGASWWPEWLFESERTKLAKRIDSNELLRKNKKEQLAQLETEMKAMPIMPRVGAFATEVQKKFTGLFQAPEETPTQKLDREIREAAEIKARKGSEKAAQRKATQEAKKAQEEANEKARIAQEEADRQAELTAQREKAQLERGEAQIKARQEFEAQKKKEDAARAKKEAEERQKKAKAKEEKREVKAKEQARITKEEAQQRAEAQKRANEVRAAEAKRIADLRNQKRELRAQRLNEERKEQADSAVLKNIDDRLKEIDEELTPTPIRSTENLFEETF